VLIDQIPHRRFNPLTREWILVSPHRGERPWLGQVERGAPEMRPRYDPACYLCPGNTRAGGARNPPYESTFVFDNDFAALLPPQPHDPTPASALFRAEAEPGLCRVVCFSPRHDLSLPAMTRNEVEAVVRTWVGQSRELASLPFVGYVQVFENKGEVMGASNPHPHSQIWATAHVPTQPAREGEAQAAYRAAHGSCLLCDCLDEERAGGDRVVDANDHFTALVPFWAIWPFEILLVANRHVPDLPALDGPAQAGLADILQRVTTRYDCLFEVSFPYSMGFHQAPVGTRSDPAWHLHAHYYPPLLRSATVKKFMVGFEMLGMPQRDLTPEQAARRLRTLGRGRP
jgi:UDPglucose--hexose-1-phosphate uridylyltransferase